MMLRSLETTGFAAINVKGGTTGPVSVSPRRPSLERTKSTSAPTAKTLAALSSLQNQWTSGQTFLTKAEELMLAIDRLVFNIYLLRN